MRLLSLVPSVLLFGAAALVLSQPACLVHCEALAVCGPDEKEVPTCPKGATCHQVEACGNTALCTKDLSCANSPCVDGALEVATCPADATCTTVVKCGNSSLCQAATCTQSSDCTSAQYCHFRDGRCGKGGAGECLARPMQTECMVGANPSKACFCDGTTGLPCAGLTGVDFDATGASCTPAATAIRCAQLICDGGTADFCVLSTGKNGSAPIAECGAPMQGCDPAQCACLTVFAAPCTCVDGPNGPTVTCPG